MHGPGGQSSDSVRDECDHTKKTESEFCPPKHQQNAFFINQVLYISFQSNHQRMPGGQSSDSVRDECDHTKKTESEFCPPEYQQKVFSYKSGTLHFLSIKSLMHGPGGQSSDSVRDECDHTKKQNRYFVLRTSVKCFFYKSGTLHFISIKSSTYGPGGQSSDSVRDEYWSVLKNC